MFLILCVHISHIFNILEKKCDYESSILITILVVVLLIFIVNLVAILYYCCHRNGVGKKQVVGRDNAGSTA